MNFLKLFEGHMSHMTLERYELLLAQLSPSMALKLYDNVLQFYQLSFTLFTTVPAKCNKNLVFVHFTVLIKT